MRAVTVPGAGGCALQVADSGPPDAPAVVLVHGISFGHQVWERQVRSAAPLRWITVDLRGHGGSDRPAGGYDDSAVWAADLHAVLGALQLDRPVLVGWSYGGVVIADYLSVYGSTGIGGVALVGATTMLGAAVAPYLGPAFAALGRGLVAADAETAVAAVDALIGLCIAGGWDPDVRLRLLGLASLVPPRVRAAMLRRTVDHTSLLRTLDLPVLIAHGRLDRVFRPELAHHHAETIAGSTLSIYDEAGHMPFWECPQRFTAEIGTLVGRR